MTVDANKTYVSPSEEYFKWVNKKQLFLSDKKSNQGSLNTKFKLEQNFYDHFRLDQLHVYIYSQNPVVLYRMIIGKSNINAQQLMSFH